MARLNVLTFAGFRTMQGFIPRGGPKALAVALDFTAGVGGSSGLDIPIDFQLMKDLDRLNFVQGIFIDNRLSGQTFLITASVIGQTLRLGAGLQAYLPFLAGDASKYVASVGNVAAVTAAGLIQVQFLNTPTAPLIW